MNATTGRTRRARVLGLLLAVATALALLAAAAAAETLSPAQRFQFELWAQNHCPTDSVVWVNAATLTYNSNEERWYGRTVNGAFACKGEADKAGYRAKP
jgi:hypothetical protein